MSTPNPALVAAAPSLIAILQAFQQLNTDMGANPINWAVNWPGASLKFVGAVDLQFPTLATAEVGVVQSDLDTKAASAISYLQGLLATPAAAQAGSPASSPAKAAAS